jgi:hypothetical protein
VRSTVTICRNQLDLTVLVSYNTRGRDRIVVAIDENGERVRLTPEERAQALARARDGQDETGR